MASAAAVRRLQAAVLIMADRVDARDVCDGAVSGDGFPEVCSGHTLEVLV